jgi:hypothetical protein
MKKLFLLSALICSLFFSTETFANSNYFGGTSGGGITGLVIGTTTATSGTSGYCLTGVSGILQNQACGITGLAVGTTTVTSGTTGYCLTNVSGILQNQACGGGANTALSNLITTSINQDLIPDGDYSRNLGDSTHRWGVLDLYFLTLTNPSYTGQVRLSGHQGNVTSYDLYFPAAAGTAGQVMQTDGAAGNLSWVTPGVALTSRASAYIATASTSFSSVSSVVVPFDTLVPGFGSTTEFDVTTNKGRFTSTKGGTYQVNSLISAITTSNIATNIYLYVNGTPTVGAVSNYQSFGNSTDMSISATVTLTAGQYIEIVIFSNSSGTPVFSGGQLYATSVQITQIQ